MSTSNTDISRIDKLKVDRDALSPDCSRLSRALSVPTVVIGDDVAASEALQVALLTCVNLAHKTFGASVPVQISDSALGAKCLTALSPHESLQDSLLALGANINVNAYASQSRFLLGDVPDEPRSLRLTFDAWQVAVGPSMSQARMKERPTCLLSAVAAAAIAVGEAFSAWSGVNIEATRRKIQLSLWRPDLPLDTPESTGSEVAEFPQTLELFGLGHLGQAYLWAIAALPFEDRAELKLYLCDDDIIESPNLETGALFGSADIGRQKTRATCDWLARRGFQARLMERFISEAYRRCDSEPATALSGFDSNEARHWLAQAGFPHIVDSGLGGEATNFDSIAVRVCPNNFELINLWPLEGDEQLRQRQASKARRVNANNAYANLAPDECGRILVADKAVAVPFVGAFAACLVLAEVLRANNCGPTFYDLRARVCSLSTRPLVGRLASREEMPRRGQVFTALRRAHSSRQSYAES